MTNSEFGNKIRNLVLEIVDLAKEKAKEGEVQICTDLKNLEDQIVDSESKSEVSLSCDDLDIKVSPSNDGQIKYTLYIPKTFKKEDVLVTSISSENKILIEVKSLKQNLNGYVDLKLPNCLKNVILKTINGDVTVKRIQTETFVLESTNGDISAIDNLFSNGLFKTENGDIDLKLDSNKYQIQCQTKNGDIDNDRESIKSATNVVKCSTINGDISIE